MSYVVCSSSQDRYPNRHFGIENQAQFTNYLGNAMMIKPHSKIAVESIKYVRLPTWSIGDNHRGYLYFGRNYNYTTSPNLDAATSNHYQVPIEFNLNPGQYTTEDIRAELQRAIRDGQYHPDDEPVVVTINSTLSGAFSGFNYVFTQKAIPTSTIPTTMAFCLPDDLNPNLPHTAFTTAVPTYAAGVITAYAAATTANHRPGFVVFPQYPISHNRGSITFNVTNAPISNLPKPKGGWAVGLTRPVRACTDLADYTTELGIVDRATPSWFDGYSIPNKIGNFPGTTNGLCMFDYVVWAQPLAPGGATAGETRLRIFSKCRTGRGTSEMKEVKYWQNQDASMTPNYFRQGVADEWDAPAGGGAYNWTDNAVGNGRIEAITAINFEVNGTFVKISCACTETGAGALTPPFIDPAWVGAAGGDIGCANIDPNAWALFPKVMFHGNDGIIAAQSIEITNYDGRTDMDADWYDNCCLYTKNYFGAMSNGQSANSTLPYHLDTRANNLINMITNSTVTAAVPRRIPFEHDVIINFVNPAHARMLPTYYYQSPHHPGANIGKLMGWGNDKSILIETVDGTVVADQVTYASPAETAPEPEATHSYFVRLNTTTQQSQNFSKGGMSKIVYHCPQFDNAGKSIGALFFQPGQRMYLELNNTETISLNELHIEIVDINEVIADDLTGNTVVCLHIK